MRLRRSFLYNLSKKNVTSLIDRKSIQFCYIKIYKNIHPFYSFVCVCVKLKCFHINYAQSYIYNLSKKDVTGLIYIEKTYYIKLKIHLFYSIAKLKCFHINNVSNRYRRRFRSIGTLRSVEIMSQKCQTVDNNGD